MKYEYLPHTADTKFRAYGATLEEAFTNSAFAMYNVMVDTSKVHKEVKHTITANGDDRHALLYDFLEQFLILLDSKNFFLSEVKSIKMNNGTVVAEVVGDDAGKYETIGPQVKAVTFNDMEIVESNEGYRIQVVLDI